MNNLMFSYYFYFFFLCIYCVFSFLMLHEHEGMPLDDKDTLYSFCTFFSGLLCFAIGFIILWRSL